MNFGILHLSEPERAMAQARRVLAPGGHFAFAADTVTVPWHVPTAELLYEAHIQSGVIVAGLIRGQTPERQQAIRDAIVEGVRRHPDGDGFTLQIAARVLSAGT